VMARRLADHATSMPPLPALPHDILEAGPPIHVLLAPDAQRFDSLAGGRVPEWGAGLAFPDLGLIVLPGYLSARAAPHELARILRHELAHVALRRHLPGVTVPRWFDEGYARWAAGEWDWEAAWQLRLAFALNRAPPLDSLTLAWPASEAEARTAYLLSTSAVAYLIRQSGERGLELFFHDWRQSGRLDTALRSTYGLTLGQFEGHWRRDVRRRYGWAFFLSHSIVFWAGIVLLLLVVTVRRRRSNRERLERLRDAEIPDAPAFWLDEDPLPPQGDPLPPEDGSDEPPTVGRP